jgi:hypothetical protein
MPEFLRLEVLRITAELRAMAAAVNLATVQGKRANEEMLALGRKFHDESERLDALWTRYREST